MKKKTIKSTLAVAVLVASAAFGYTSYTQHQDNQLAYANPLIEENINALADAPGFWDSKIYKAEPSKKTTLVLVGETVPRKYVYKGTVVIGNISYLVYEYLCNDCVSGNVYAHCWEIPNRC